jgi:taurine--2-oxoglutarate transaminase
MNKPIANPAKGAEVFADDRAHVFHSWSAQAQISPIPVAGSQGSYFWDYEGKTYLDFSCQLVFTSSNHDNNCATTCQRNEK